MEASLISRLNEVRPLLILLEKYRRSLKSLGFTLNTEEVHAHIKSDSLQVSAAKDWMMKALIDVKPTAEQLALFSRTSPGVEVIRGAAGSGKTTTALLKLRSSAGYYLNRAKRRDPTKPVKILVLTFNRTLRGYIAELTEQQFNKEPMVHLECSTFNKWAQQLVKQEKVLNIKQTQSILYDYALRTKMDADFVVDEAQYVLGRFPPDRLSEYLIARRDGRGVTPRMERAARQRLLDDVIHPYIALKQARGLKDWNDLAINLSSQAIDSYDVIVVDETQDFSANEVRAILNQRSADASVTFVLDSAQRIYSRNFTWAEVGVALRPEKSHTLHTNYRNTRQIAEFASAILKGIDLDDNGTMPNYKSAVSEGEKPMVLIGSYLAQAQSAIDYIKSIDLKTESVAFLHPKGWFRSLRPLLHRHGLQYVELTAESSWPQGNENIALCTMHSSKGLEFDHVIVIGLDGSILDVEAAENQLEGPDNENNHELSIRLRRLIAMGVGRARSSVMLGFKPEDKPDIMRFVTDGLYSEVQL